MIAFGYDCQIRLYRTTHTKEGTEMTLVFEDPADPEEDLEIGYIDSDPFPDLVALTQDGKVVVYLSGGTSLLDRANLPDRMEYALPENTTGANKVWLGDLNGDENRMCWRPPMRASSCCAVGETASSCNHQVHWSTPGRTPYRVSWLRISTTMEPRRSRWAATGEPV